MTAAAYFPTCDMSDDIEVPAEQKKTLNTVLLSVVIAVSGFLAMGVVNLLVAVGQIQATQITRPELETKMMALQQGQEKLQEQLVTLQLKITQIEDRAREKDAQ